MLLVTQSLPPHPKLKAPKLEPVPVAKAVPAQPLVARVVPPTNISPAAPVQGGYPQQPYPQQGLHERRHDYQRKKSATARIDEIDSQFPPLESLFQQSGVPQEM